MKAKDIKPGMQLIMHGRPTYSPKFLGYNGYLVEILAVGEHMEYQTASSWTEYSQRRETDRGVRVRKIEYNGRPIDQPDEYGHVDQDIEVVQRPEFFTDDVDAWREHWAKQRERHAERDARYAAIRARRQEIAMKLSDRGVFIEPDTESTSQSFELSLDEIEQLIGSQS